MKKKVDNRIRTLIENGVAQRHRSFFVLVGDKGKDQVTTHSTRRFRSRSSACASSVCACQHSRLTATARSLACIRW